MLINHLLCGNLLRLVFLKLSHTEHFLTRRCVIHQGKEMIKRGIVSYHSAFLSPPCLPEILLINLQDESFALCLPLIISNHLPEIHKKCCRGKYSWQQLYNYIPHYQRAIKGSGYGRSEHFLLNLNPLPLQYIKTKTLQMFLLISVITKNCLYADDVLLSTTNIVSTLQQSRHFSGLAAPNLLKYFVAVTFRA